MVRSTIHLHLGMPAESTVADFTSPLAHVRLLPDVRFDKILATRDALQRNHYDSDAVLDEEIQRLCSDLKVACRDDR